MALQLPGPINHLSLPDIERASQGAEMNDLRIDAARQQQGDEKYMRLAQFGLGLSKAGQEGLSADPNWYKRMYPRIAQEAQRLGMPAEEVPPPDTSPAELMQSFRDMQQALEMGGGPERESQYRPTAPEQNYDRRQKLVEQYGEGSPQVQTFDRYVRAGRITDVGGVPTEIGAGGDRPLSTLEDEAAGQATIAARVEGAKTGAKIETTDRMESEQNRTANILASRSAINDINDTIDDIDRAIGLSSWWSTGAVGQIMQGLGATDARSLKAALEPIKASLAFDRLQQMRDASKTGGALGQVSERELDLLMGALESLDQAQKPGQIVNALKRVRKHYERVRQLHVGTEAIAEGAPFVTSPQEAMQLPPGAVFVNPDGQVLRVPSGR